MVEQRKERSDGLGSKVDFHCPYDEATLRVDLTRPGYYTCPCCYTPFRARGEKANG